MFAALRRYVIAGLLVWLPLWATVVVIRALVGFMDRTLVLIPTAYHPENLLGFHIPGLGVVLTLVLLVVTGALIANILGSRLVAIWEELLSHIPLVRSIYSSVKQLTETLFSDTGKSFREVVLVEFPRKGVWTIAFVTGNDVGEAQEKTGHDVVNVYVPTTPNPTGGYFIMVPREDLTPLAMSVDDGLKMLLSMGAVVPKARPKPEQAPEQPPQHTG